nr:hypothetical protein [uncultured Cohaesibacter sp.]
MDNQSAEFSITAATSDEVKTQRNMIANYLNAGVIEPMFTISQLICSAG